MTGVGFHSIAEGQDTIATCRLDERSAALGWRLRQDVQSNTTVNMRRDGSLALTVKYVLPAQRAQVLLDVLREPGGPETIAGVVDAAVARLNGGEGS